MRIRNLHFAICILQFALLGNAVLGGEPSPPVGARGECLVVTLNTEVTVKARFVLLKDVATFSGAAPVLTGRLAALDVADAPPPSASIIISKEQVAFRLQLAGVDRRAFRLEGPARVVVHSSEADKETNRQGDKETRRQGDKEKARASDDRVPPSPCLLVSLSPCPSSPLLTEQNVET